MVVAAERCHEERTPLDGQMSLFLDQARQVARWNPGETERLEIERTLVQRAEGPFEPFPDDWKERIIKQIPSMNQ